MSHAKIRYKNNKSRKHQNTRKIKMYSIIISLENLYQASKNALKNKKSKQAPAKFWLHEDKALSRMHQELKEYRYKWGGYTSFILNDKGIQRRISVAPFRDRVLHHAIMQNIEPLFQKSFGSFHSSSCGMPIGLTTHHNLSTFNNPSIPS